MASPSRTHNIRGRGSVIPAYVLAPCAAVLGAPTFVFATPASADDSAGGTVARVPAAQLPDTPGDCSVR